MKYNKAFLKKTNDRKHLRKVKKNWVVASVASFAFLGGAAFVQSNSFASAAEETQSATPSTTATENTQSSSATATEKSAQEETATNSQNERQTTTAPESKIANEDTTAVEVNQSQKSNLSGLQISVLNDQSEVTAGSSLTLSVNINFNSLQTAVKAGDKITFSVPNNVVDWDNVKSLGGDNLGTLSHDAASNTVTFTFTQDIQNKIGSFGFNVFLPIKSDAASKGNVIFTQYAAKDGQNLSVPVTGSTFNIGAGSHNESLPEGTNRMQAPGVGNANNIHKYSGSDIVINSPVNFKNIKVNGDDKIAAGYSHNVNQYGENVTTDSMTVYDILQPDKDNSKVQTGRKYTFTVDGPDASIDLNSFRFQLPSGSDVVDGKGWGTLSQVQDGSADGISHPGFQLIQLANNKVQLILPNGMNIQNMTVIFNIIAPDTRGTYVYDQPYTDDQGTGSWNSAQRMIWYNPQEVFAPTPKISVPFSKSALTTDNIPDVNSWLKENVTASVPTSNGNVDLTKDVQIVDDGGVTAAWQNKQQGNYTVTYQVIYTTTINGEKVSSLAKATGTVTIVSPSAPSNQVGKLTVRYVDENGNEISGMPEKQMAGIKGNVYTVDTPSIKGYQYENSSAALTGVYGDDATIT
ncbi:MucBP domain-containing protein, partial [Fructobacillus fructosus]|uniref:MucBP domain-containing protein n=1 Tax=Fructobacillus fructosus TaxID=1631 RepID=UPI00200A4E0A